MANDEKNASLETVQKIFREVCWGRAHIRLGGDIAGFDEKGRGVVFVKNQAGKVTGQMPAAEFTANLSQGEIDEVLALRWDGSNGFEISLAVMNLTERAIRRFHAIPIKAECEAEWSGDCEFFVESIVDGVVVRRGCQAAA